jgi:Dirigent-like protein
VKALRLLLPAALVVAVLLPSAAQARSTLVLRLISVSTSSSVDDRPPAGASVGDSFTETSRLRNAVAQLGRPKGAVVGTDRATTTLISAQAVRMEGTVRLPGGTLTIRGRVTLRPGSASVPVAGGTGRFAGARGTVTATALPDGRSASNVYRLTLP